MDRTRWIEFALSRAPKDLPRGFVRVAAQQTWKERAGKVYQQHFSDAIELARAMVEAARQEESAAATEHTLLALGVKPRERLFSELAVVLIQDRVEAAREELFGQQEAPFSASEAAAWIRTEEAAGRRGMAATPDPSAEERLAATAQEYWEKYRIIISQSKEYLPYQDPDQKFGQSAWVGSSRALSRLKLVADAIAGQTGFARDAVVMHVLTGLEPVLPAVRMSIRTRMGLKWSNTVDLQFNSADISYRDFRALFSMVRRALPRTRVTEKELNLWRAVRDTDGPRRGKVYWESVLERWGNSQAKTWETAKVSWHRLRRKLGL